MCKRTLEIKPVQGQSLQHEPLVYKDASDDSDQDSSEFDEEITEIQLGQPKKRRQVDLYGDEEPSEDQLDDSVSSSDSD